MDSIEEIFRTDQIEKKRDMKVPLSHFSKSLILLASSVLIYTLATVLFDTALERYILYHVAENWEINFSIFIISKALLGLSYIIVGNFYVRLTKTISLTRAGLTSFFLTIWGVMHLYDSMILFTLWPSPDELLKILQNTSEATIYLNVLLNIIIVVAIFYMGYNFIRISSINVISSKVKISGIFLLIGSLLYLVVSIINVSDYPILLIYADMLFYFGELLLFIGFLLAGASLYMASKK